MPRIVSDERIAEWLADTKPITKADIRALKTGIKARSDRQLTTKIEVTGKSKRHYRLTSNKCSDPLFPNKFSIILATTWYGRNINLVRCNGWHGPHENPIEIAKKISVQRIPSNTFHIHLATKRYQQVPEKDAETYAEPTTEYHSFESAIDYMCGHFGFIIKEDQISLFPLFEWRSL